MQEFCVIGLHSPKNSANVGGALRAAAVFGARCVIVARARTGRMPTDTTRSVPLFRVDDLRDMAPYDAVPVAIEAGRGLLDPHAARPLKHFRHPLRAYYIFGPEEGSVPHNIVRWCRDVVTLDVGCLNLAAMVNVVLYARHAYIG